jgi:hypothetical protein
MPDLQYEIQYQQKYSLDYIQYTINNLCVEADLLMFLANTIHTSIERRIQDNIENGKDSPIFSNAYRSNINKELREAITAYDQALKHLCKWAEDAGLIACRKTFPFTSACIPERE